MNLSIIRTTASGKETLNIKDASEGIAYAVLRRFLPEQRDALIPDPIRVKVDASDDVQPFRVSREDLPGKPDDFPDFLTTETASALKVPEKPVSTVKTKESAKTFIKAAQEKARKELQDQFKQVGNELKDKLVEKVESPAEDKPRYHAPKVIQKNGMDLYTCEIICGACGRESSSLVRQSNQYAKCKDCGQKLTVEQMYDEPLAANKAGYAFKANAPFIHYREQRELREEMVAHGTDH